MWEFVVTDKNGTNLGELSAKAYDRGVRIPLNAPRSCSFRTRSDNPLNATLLDAGKTRVAAYRDGTLQFCGPVVTFQDVGAGAGSGVSFVAIDAAWRLSKLLIGKSTTGYKQGTAAAPVSLAAIVTAILAAAGGAAVHGIAAGSIATTATGYVGPWYYKNALEAISELADTLEGFDWKITPQSTPGSGTYGQLEVADYIGTTKPNAVWEYGAGKSNASGYSRAGSADALLTSGYSLPSGYPDAAPGQTVRTAQDAAAVADYGLFEEVIDSDLVVDALRTKLLEEHVRIRKVPRQTIQFQPTVHDGLDFGTDYDVGDVVGFRATQGGEKIIDVQQRIFAVEFSIDNEGNETKNLTVAVS